MAHQCLKCGETYPDGSPQILKGCEGCKGTRFFYTDAPLADKEREELAEQTELDLEKLALGKGGREASSPRRLPTKGEFPLGSERQHDWVAGGPNYLRGVVEDVVRRASERKPVFRVGAADPPSKSLSEWVRERDGVPAPDADPVDGPDDLLDGLFEPDREAAWREEAPVDRSGPDEEGAMQKDDGPEAEVVYKRAPRRVPKPVSLAGVAVDPTDDAELREAAAAAAKRQLSDEGPRAERPRLNQSSGVDESLYPEGQVPETVAVKDSGVYELDVKRLLEKNPLVIHRDGSYSLHLPSLMETLERKKQR